MSPTLLESTRPLRAAGYFVAVATIIMQATELLLRSWPFRFSSAAWRVGFNSGASSILLSALLMTFLILAIAAINADDIAALLTAGFSVLVVIVLIGLCGMFMLDALQLRNQIQMSVARQYDVTSAWVLVREVVGIVGFITIALAGFRSAKVMRPQNARRGARGGAIVVGAVRPPAAPGLSQRAGFKDT